MLTALTIAAGAFAYIQIGKKWGGWRYASFRQAKRTGEKPVSHLINFPLTYLLENTYEDSDSLANAISQENEYKFIFSLVWPLAILWVPIGITLSATYGIGNAFYNPVPTLNAGLNAIKRLKSQKTDAPALPPPEIMENNEPGLDNLREELNVAMFDQEEASVRVNTLQEKIFVEESRLQGSYREAALPERKQ